MSKSETIEETVYVCTYIQQVAALCIAMNIWNRLNFRVVFFFFINFISFFVSFYHSSRSLLITFLLYGIEKTERQNNNAPVVYAYFKPSVNELVNRNSEAKSNNNQKPKKEKKINKRTTIRRVWEKNTTTTTKTNQFISHISILTFFFSFHILIIYLFSNNCFTILNNLQEFVNCEIVWQEIPPKKQRDRSQNRKKSVKKRRENCVKLWIFFFQKKRR